MKKLVMLCATVLLSACPVACINDPTTSDDVPTSWETDTGTSSLSDEEKKILEDAVKELESTGTETVTDSSTATE